jgi:hypothetical protein
MQLRDFSTFGAMLSPTFDRFRVGWHGLNLGV